MPSPADDYLAAALAFMEQHSLHRDLIDWPTLRHTATQHAADAATPADTYDAIRWALTQLQDRHSFFAPPDHYVDGDDHQIQTRAAAWLHETAQAQPAQPLSR